MTYVRIDPQLIGGGSAAVVGFGLSSDVAGGDFGHHLAPRCRALSRRDLESLCVGVERGRTRPDHEGIDGGCSQILFPCGTSPAAGGETAGDPSHRDQ